MCLKFYKLVSYAVSNLTKSLTNIKIWKKLLKFPLNLKIIKIKPAISSVCMKWNILCHRLNLPLQGVDNLGNLGNHGQIRDLYNSGKIWEFCKNIPKSGNFTFLPS